MFNQRFPSRETRHRFFMRESSSRKPSETCKYLQSDTLSLKCIKSCFHLILKKNQPATKRILRASVDQTRNAPLTLTGHLIPGTNATIPTDGRIAGRHHDLSIRVSIGFVPSVCNKITSVGAHKKPSYRFRDTRLPLEETAPPLPSDKILFSSLCRLCVTEPWGGRRSRFRSKFSAL